MSLIYITGSPGSGKSSAREELLKRGFAAYGGGEDKIAAYYESSTGERIYGPVSTKDRTPEWRSRHRWKILPRDIEKLKLEAKDKPVFLCAITHNEAELWDLFDKVIILQIDENTMRQRLAIRVSNKVGKAESELEELLAERAAKEYPKNAILIDATRPLKKVVDDVIESVAKSQT